MKAKVLYTLVGYAGAGAIVYGVGLVSQAAAWIVGGMILFAAAVSICRDVDKAAKKQGK